MMTERLIEVYQPEMKLDALGELVEARRRLDSRSLHSKVDYFYKGGQLLQRMPDNSWLNPTPSDRTNENKLMDLTKATKRNMELNLEEKIEIYLRGLQKKLNLKPRKRMDARAQHDLLKNERTFKIWGQRSCPGLKRINRWLKLITRESTKDDTSKPPVKVLDEDCCRDDHSEGCVSLNDDNEEPQKFDKATFQNGVRYAFYMTFCKHEPWRAQQVYSDPAIVFRLYLSKYLHSDKEREKAAEILNKPLPEKPRFSKIVKQFLVALQEGNADASPVDNDLVSLYQGIMEPEEVMRMTHAQTAKTELRTTNLQECIKVWTEKPNYRLVKTSENLVDTNDSGSSAEATDQEEQGFIRRISQLKGKKASQIAGEDASREERYAKALKTVRKPPPSYSDVTRYDHYLQKLDVSLNGNDIIILCLKDKLHYIGKLGCTDILALIESSEKMTKGDGDWNNNHRKVIYELIPLIMDLLEIKNRRDAGSVISFQDILKELDPENISIMLDNYNPQDEGPKIEDESQSGLESTKNKSDSTKISPKINTIQCRNYTIRHLKKYLERKKKIVKCENKVVYDQRFYVMVNEKNKQIYTLPKFYKFGKWAKKLSEESLQNFLKSRNLINMKDDYIIHVGTIALKGQEKVVKKCLLALRNLGIKEHNLKVALILYAKLLCSNVKDFQMDDLREPREKFKIAKDQNDTFLRLKQLESNIKQSNYTNQESWLKQDEDYAMKTFISGNKKTEQNYENNFNARLKIAESKEKNEQGNELNDLDDYKNYNFAIDTNFAMSNDYSSEEGDKNENHYIDNLCSCGMKKEEYTKINYDPPKNPESKAHIEYHKVEKKDGGEDSSAKENIIKMTGFLKASEIPKAMCEEPKAVKRLSRETMLELHSVFDYGLKEFNKEHVLQVVEFFKALDKGELPELVLKRQPESQSVEEDTGEPVVKRCSSKIDEADVKQKQSVRKEEKTGGVAPSPDEAEKYLQTEYFPEEEQREVHETYASEQSLPTRYLERVFHNIQHLSK